MGASESLSGLVTLKTEEPPALEARYKKKVAPLKLQVHQLLHYNVRCSCDLHINVLWDQYASELKRLMKKS